MATATDINDRSKINWNTSIFMVIFHLGAITALFMFSWRALLLMLLIWWVAGSLGVGMGFHRLLTHRGYKTPKAVDSNRHRTGAQRRSQVALRPRPDEGSGSGLDEPTLFRAAYYPGNRTAWAWRLVGDDVGNFSTRDTRSARDMVGQLRNAHLGPTALCYH